MPVTRSQTTPKRRPQPTASTPSPSTRPRGRPRVTPRGGKHTALPSSAFDPPALPRTRTPPLRIVHSPPPRRWATPSTESSGSSSQSRSPSRSGSRSRSCSRERGGGSSTPRPMTPIRWRSATPIVPSFPLQTSPPEARFYAARYGTPIGHTRYRRPQPQLEARDGGERGGSSELEVDDTEMEKLMDEWIDVNGDFEQGNLAGASTVAVNSVPSSSRVPSPGGHENKSTHGERVSIHAHSILAHDTTQIPVSTSIAPSPAVHAPMPLPPAAPHPLIRGLMSRLSPETQAAMLSRDPDVDGRVQFTERDMDIVRRILGILPRDQLTEIARAVERGGGTDGVAPQRRMSERLQAPGQSGPSTSLRYGLPADYGQGSNVQDRQTWWEVASQPAWKDLTRLS